MNVSAISHTPPLRASGLPRADMRSPTPRAAAVFALLCTSWAVQAAAQPAPGWAPDRVYLQVGVAEAAQTAVAGLVWERPWRHHIAGGELGLYWEVSFGRWRGEREGGGRGNAWVTQLGVTPVVRWQRAGAAPRWFAEAGIGANLLLPVYRSRAKSFSTRFNFGDHVAVGRRFGADGRHELALRFQHFSNAGLRHPNPGENFVQLRWAWRY